MEKKIRKSGIRIGILDMFIILLVVVGIFAAVKLSVPVSAAGVADDNMTFVVELQKKEVYFLNHVKKGEILYENLKGAYLGEVIDVEILPYTTVSPDVVAKMQREKPVDGLYNIYITVSANASSAAGVTVINGYEVAVGKEMFIRTKSIASVGYCVEVDLGGQ